VYPALDAGVHTTTARYTDRGSLDWAGELGPRRAPKKKETYPKFSGGKEKRDSTRVSHSGWATLFGSLAHADSGLFAGDFSATGDNYQKTKKYFTARLLSSFTKY